MSEITLYNSDCLEQLKTIPENSIDIIITSPPYNLGNTHHTREKRHKPYEDNMPEEEYQKWQIEILKECFRVLTSSGSLLYNHKHRIKDGLAISPYEWLLKTPLKLKQMLIWVNGSPNFDKCRFFPFTEEIYWLSKTEKVQFINKESFSNIFKWTPEGTGKFHSRAFPKKMIFDLLQCFPDSQAVLDPFMGSGTVGVVCKTFNKNFIGIEKNKTFFDYAKKRIDLDLPEDSKVKIENSQTNTLF